MPHPERCGYYSKSFQASNNPAAGKTHEGSPALAAAVVNCVITFAVDPVPADPLADPEGEAAAAVCISWY